VLAITDLGKERTWCWLPSPVRSPSIKAVSAAKCWPWPIAIHCVARI